MKVASDSLCLLEIKKEEILQRNFTGDIETIDPKVAALDILYRIKCFEDIIAVLKLAKSHWPKASYYSASFSRERLRQLKKSPNTPINTNQLKEKLDDFKPKHLIMNEFHDLVESIVEIKKKIKRDRKEQQQTFDCSARNQRTKDGVCTSSARCSGFTAAKDCQLKCCGKCCPGPCKRHHLTSKSMSSFVISHFYCFNANF